MRGGASETACPCCSSSPVPVPGPRSRSRSPKCTLLLLESWPGAEPSDKPELLVFSKTGMPQSQLFNRFHTLNSSVSLALSRASLIVPASLETSQLGQRPTFRPPFKGASSYYSSFSANGVQSAFQIISWAGFLTEPTLGAYWRVPAGRTFRDMISLLTA